MCNSDNDLSISPVVRVSDDHDIIYGKLVCFEGQIGARNLVHISASEFDGEFDERARILYLFIDNAKLRTSTHSES